MEDQGLGAIGDIMLDAGSVGQVLLRLEQVKAEIVEEVRTRTNAAVRETEALKNGVIEKLGTISTGLERVVTCVTSSHRTSRSHGSRSRGAENRKRSIPDPDEVQYLGVVADRERAVMPLLRCSILLTVLCFIEEFPFFGNWVTERAKENMSHCSSLLPGVSGFSLMFFSVPSDEPKARFKGKMGKLWSFWCSHTIVMMLMSARVENFNFEDPVTGKTTVTGHTVPAWLQSFGGVRRATAIVSDVVESLEQTCVVPMSRTKKPKTQIESTPADDMEVKGAREQAVRVIRSGILRTLSSGRTEARMHVFRSLIFLVEKIHSFDSIGEARAQGYEIELDDDAAEDELCVPEGIATSIWKIPRMSTTGTADAEPNKTYVELFKELPSKFPSLSVVLKYKMSVERKAQDTADGHPEFSQENLFWPVREKVSLHRVAIGILVEMFRARNFASVLSSSALSFRAVHIFAIALRGLICKGLQKPLTDMKRAALGDVTFRMLQKGEDLATVMLGNRMDARKETDEKSALEKEREAKFEMTWSQYKARKAQREAEQREQEETTRSVGGQMHEDVVPAQQDDFDVSWIGE